MSIWNYLNDIELQTLREAYGRVQDAEAILLKIGAAKADAEARLRAAKKARHDARAHVVAKAMGDDFAPTDEAEVSIEELEFLIVGLENRQAEQKHQIETQTHRYKAQVKQCLQACIARASATYTERAQALIESWKELNAAQVELGDRELAWIHLFIPALPGMVGSQESHSRASLFDGQQQPLEAEGRLERELRKRFK